MGAVWFVRGGGKVYGPLDSARLKQLVVDGKIDQRTEVAQSADGPWHPAGNVKGLFLPPVVPPPVTNQASLSTVESAAVTTETAARSKRSWYTRWWIVFVLYPLLAFMGCGVVIQLVVPKETRARWEAEAEERSRKQAEKSAADKLDGARAALARTRGEDAGHQAGFLWAKVGKRKPERIVIDAAAALEAEKAIPSNTALVGSGSDAERKAYARGYSSGFTTGYDKAK